MATQPAILITNGSITAALSTSPTGSEAGIITRNIPFGTQNIASAGGALALDSTLTGGALKALLFGAAVGTTTSNGATVRSISANVQALDVQIATSLPTGTNSIGTVVLGTGSAAIGTVSLTAGSAAIGTISLTSGAAAIGSITNTSFIATQATPGAHTNYFWNRLTDGTNDVVVSAGGAIKIDGSAVTQPVSGSITANIGTTNGLALDATLTGGTAKFQLGNGANYAALTNENSSYGLNVHVNNVSPIAVSMSTAAAATTTGSLAAVNATVIATVSNYDSALVTMKGTFAGITAQFWVSDDNGVTYYAVQGVRTDTNIAGNTFVLTANSNTSYYVNVSGATNLQVKASTYSTGAVSVRVSPNGSSFAPNVISALTDNSGNIGTITAGGSLNSNVTNTVTVSGTVALSTGSAAIGTVSLTSGSAAIGTVSLTTGSAAIGSITNTSFVATQAAPTTHGNYFWNKITDGTNDAVIATSAPTSSAAGIVVRSISNDAAVSTWSNITTNTTTTIKASAGTLFRVIINGSGDPGNIATIYDSATATGTKIATVNLSAEPTTLNFNLATANGITILTSGGTNVGDITVVYA